MSALGVHFAITAEQRSGLEAQASDRDRIDYLREHIEQAWDRDHLVVTDKAWDAMHRCLAEYPPDTPWFYPVDPVHGAYALPEDHGTLPLKLCVLGGKRLMDSEENYFMRLVEPAEAAALAPALDALDEADMRARYFKHCKGAWPEYGEEDFDYTWEYFEDVRDFYRRMAGNGRAVLFTASQ